MILLDTNVISELMRPKPDVSVYRWIDQQHPSGLAISVFTVAEIQRGIRRLASPRALSLAQRFDRILEENFAGRVWVFDEVAANAYADLAAQRESQGLHVHAVDGMIAAIAHVRDATIATRNFKDFNHCGVALVNPWEADRC